METVEKIINGSLVVTYPQAARLLGVSESLVRKLVRQQKLRKVKLGRSARIPVEELTRICAVKEGV